MLFRSKALTADAVLKDLLAKARNVGGYAPGELQALVDQGSAVRIPMTDYKRWLYGLSPALRNKVIKDWGAPEKTRVMTLPAPTTAPSPTLTGATNALLEPMKACAPMVVCAFW